MKKIVAVVLLLALIGGVYFLVKRPGPSSGSGETTEKSSDSAPSTEGPGTESGEKPGTDSSSGTPGADSTSTDSTSAGMPGDESKAPVAVPPGSESGSTGGSEAESGKESGSGPSTTAPGGGTVGGRGTRGKVSKTPAEPGSSIPWIQGSIGLRGDHVSMVDRFVSAIEERNPETMTRFFSKEMKSRSSIAGKGRLKSFIKQVLMGEGFFGGLTNPDTRKIRSIREGVFHFTVKYEVSNPRNDEEDIPVTVKFQFEKTGDTYLITQVSEKRG